MVDTSVFHKLKTPQDYQREHELVRRARQEFEMNKKYKQAQIGKLQADTYASMQPKPMDVGKLGEQAFIKKAQGMPLSITEESAMRFMDAKSGGTIFNPVTGAQMNKPTLSQLMGLDSTNGRGISPTPAKLESNPASTSVTNPESAEENPYDLEYKRQMEMAAGNPKLQQDITKSYLNSKTDMNLTQSNAAGFADRMATAMPILDKHGGSLADIGDATQSMIPVAGNYLVSDNYQKADQARRDFVNAVLRKESGAAITADEFANASRQYFPVPGDSEATVEQKRLNRITAYNSIVGAAGPAYRPTNKYTPPASQQPKFLGFE